MTDFETFCVELNDLQRSSADHSLCPGVLLHFDLIFSYLQGMQVDVNCSEPGSKSELHSLPLALQGKNNLLNILTYWTTEPP